MKADAVRYTLTVTITQPLGGDDPDAYVDPKSKCQLEKDVIAALRTLDGDADAEVIDVAVLDADGLTLREQPEQGQKVSR